MTSKYPDRKLAVLSCMDTRLTELLPKDVVIEGFVMDSVAGALNPVKYEEESGR